MSHASLDDAPASAALIAHDVPATDAFIAHDRRFAAVLGDAPRLVRLVETGAHEGLVYAADEDALYFTTVPRPRPEGPLVAIMRLALTTGRLSVLRADANAANGMALDRDGSLVVCEQGSRTTHARISRVDRATGAAETLVDAWEGRCLNSPNDVVVGPHGAVWFTDPSYGHLQGFRPAPEVGDHVYRYDPTGGRLSVVADTLDKPNGLAFSPDGSVLYLADNGVPHRLEALDVEDGRPAGPPRVVADLPAGHPDGVKVDLEGRVYASTPDGVRVLGPDGATLGEIALPGAVNLGFGGAGRNVLFITADTAVWAAVLNTKGA